MPTQMRDVLVADDNPMLLMVLSEIFKECGYVVQTASDGFSALAAIRHRMPDILISDLNMPGMSGFELLSIVRRRFPSVAAIAMSGAFSDAAIPSGIAADAFYAKGSSSVARLFDLMSAIADDIRRNASRTSTPVWITNTPVNQTDSTLLAIACPECLRTFSRSLHKVRSKRAEYSCPHCLNLVQVAIVGFPEEVDTTPLLRSLEVGRCGIPAPSREHAVVRGE